MSTSQRLPFTCSPSSTKATGNLCRQWSCKNCYHLLTAVSILTTHIMAQHNDLGRWGESTAASFLLERGYQIIAKNYRSWQAEIDLIAQKGKMLIFVEVKTRSGTAFGMPEEFVNAAKAKLVMRAAENYIFDT